MPHPGSRRDAPVVGRPIKPGQVLNPEGRNQYTYISEAEQDLDKWLREKENGQTNSSAIIERLVIDAKSGVSHGYAMKLVLDRILPAVNKHEHTGAGGGPIALSSAAEWDELTSAMDSLRRVSASGAKEECHSRTDS